MYVVELRGQWEWIIHGHYVSNEAKVSIYPPRLQGIKCCVGDMSLGKLCPPFTPYCHN